MSTRFEELKTIGYGKLNSEQRKEYLELKNGLGSVEEPTPTPIATQPPINPQNLEERLNPLPGTEWRNKKEQPKRQFTATLRKYRADTRDEYGLVVGMKFLRNDYDENTRRYDKQMYMISLRMPDGNIIEKEIPYVLLAEINEVEKCKILNLEKKTLVKNHGSVVPAPVGKGGFVEGYHLDVDPDARSGERVPLDENVDTYLATIEIENGDIITLDSRRLN